MGELALVKLQPYRQHSVVLRKNQNLSLRHFGPFDVIEKIGPVAFKLLFPQSAKIHPVFHISLLKKFHGDQKQHYLPLPLTTNEFGPLVQPISISDARTIVNKGKEIAQWLIKWDTDDSSWEYVKVMQKSYPNFNLEDMVDVQEGSIVTRTKEVDKLVNREGHVASNIEGQEVRKSSRNRRKSIN